MRKAADRILTLEEMLEGKQAALDRVLNENEQLKTQLSVNESIVSRTYCIFFTAHYCADIVGFFMLEICGELVTAKLSFIVSFLHHLIGC